MTLIASYSLMNEQEPSPHVTMKNLAGARSALEFIGRANTEAHRRGHAQRTAYAGAGGLLGALLGSFFGRAGAGLGGLFGALLGAVFGQRRDQRVPALPQPKGARRLERPAATVAHRDIDYIDVTSRA